jgi:hypothetical protein
MAGGDPEGNVGLGGTGWLTFAQMGQQAAGFVFGGFDVAGSEIDIRRDGTLTARRVIRLRLPRRN